MAPSSIDHLKVIRDVASRIVKKADMEELGKKLGFDIYDIETYDKNNYVQGKVTTEGTNDMIREWQEKHQLDPADLWPVLSKALLAARLLKIVGDIERKYPGLVPEKASPGKDSVVVSMQIP